jgi:predicted bacteriocin transport accessory protein
MKRLFFILLCLFLCCSCASKPKEPAQVLTIGKADFEHKMEQKDTFVFLVTRTQCEYCQELLKMIDYTKEDYSLKIYHLEMRDDTVEHFNEDLDFLEGYLERPDQTPHYYYIEEGEVVAQQMGYTSLNPDRFWEWAESIGIE